MSQALQTESRLPEGTLHARTMIPIAILLGIAVGVSGTRHRWPAIAIIAAAWSLLLMIAGDPTLSMAAIWTGGLALGGLNAGVGVLIGWGARRLGVWLGTRLSRRHHLDAEPPSRR